MSPRPAGDREGLLRTWFVMLAVLWAVLFGVLGAITGDFDATGVARSFALALAISAGSVLGRRRRRHPSG